MFQFVIKRILMMIPVLLAVSTIVFLLIHVIPGDPVDIILGEQALAADRAELAHEMHLDLPLATQYARFVGGLAEGDWGRSIFDGRPVLSHLKERAGATFILALCAMSIAILVAIPAGIIAAVKRGGLWDRAMMVMALAGISVPNFWLGPVLILIFSVHFRLLPISGGSSVASLILPAVTLGFGVAAMISRLTRASMMEEIRREYMTTARAKGLSERTVMYKHALRNALNPVISIVGLQVGSLLAGAIITERVFGWPGIGMLLIDSISRRDYPVVSGCVLAISFAYVIINTATDCLYKVADPRIKL
ncbi:MAG: ABC transporter permease [Pseudomonadota bacterium]